MKRAMRKSSQTKECLLASSIWQLKNNYKHMKRAMRISSYTGECLLASSMWQLKNNYKHIKKILINGYDNNFLDLPPNRQDRHLSFL